MTQQLSDKLRVMSAVSIVIVLYIHSSHYNGFYIREAAPVSLPVTTPLQTLLGYEIGRCAVPLFFAISGYLFFRDIDLGSSWREAYKALWPKMVKRVRTLLVPYLLAAWFAPLLLLALEHVPGISYDYTFFTDTFNGPLPDLLRMVYWDSGSGVPFAFQLWFLRDLIIIVALSPLLLLIARVLNLRNRWGYCNLTALLFLLTFLPLPSLLPVTGAMWFVAGRALLRRLPSAGAWIVSAAFIALCIVEMSTSWQVWHHVQLPVIALGVWAMWTVYDRMTPATFTLAAHPRITAVCRCTFFVYLFHIPVLKFCIKALLVVCGQSDAAFAVAFVAAPWLFLVFCIPAAMLLRRYVPLFYGVVTGGR